MMVLHTKFIRTTIFIVVLYIIGFFVLSPAIYAANGRLKNILSEVDSLLYSSWVLRLSDESSIKNVWIFNASYWCDLSSRCINKS
jgi:uncharacterized membrane protein SpoIIM required for sporulation